MLLLAILAVLLFAAGAFGMIGGVMLIFESRFDDPGEWRNRTLEAGYILGAAGVVLFIVALALLLRLIA